MLSSMTRGKHDKGGKQDKAGKQATRTDSAPASRCGC